MARRKKRGRRRYPHLKIQVEVRDRDDNTIVEYTYWLDDDQARQAFAARLPDAYRAGQAVLTYLADD